MFLLNFQASYLSLALLPFCLVATWYYSYAIYAGRRFSQGKQKTASQGFYPPVSVIKPLCGLDFDTYQNLASFCQQIYPNYQIIFSVQNPLDPCITVVKQIIYDYPALDLQLVISDVSIGANQKVNNLANAAAIAKHPILVLADSDVRVGPSYLQQIIQPLQDPTVGPVTCLYRPLGQGTVANFEALGISTDYLASVIVAHRLEGLQFTLGPTVVVRTSALEAVGGFAAIADYLADDFQIGFLLAQAHY
ncbi:MAG: glycosyltransferase, partial [Thermosynechococcaceae cyanobacterium]